jgi:hypothetical protein
LLKKFIALFFIFSNYASSQSIIPNLETISQNGNVIKIFSELRPITINNIHNWIINIEDSKNNPINDLIITVTGGMPIHSHGLPTSPKVTSQISSGLYKLEGIKFHMAGEWEIIMELKNDDSIDIAKIVFDIK